MSAPMQDDVIRQVKKYIDGALHPGVREVIAQNANAWERGRRSGLQEALNAIAEAEQKAATDPVSPPSPPMDESRLSYDVQEELAKLRSAAPPSGPAQKES